MRTQLPIDGKCCMSLLLSLRWQRKISEWEQSSQYILMQRLAPPVGSPVANKFLSSFGAPPAHEQRLTTMAAGVGQLGQLVIPCATLNSNAVKKGRAEGLFLGRRSHYSGLTHLKAAPLLFIRKNKQPMENPHLFKGQVVAAVSTGSEPVAAPVVDFKKLQNGSDIRGVAVPGVEGEPVNLTEPITQAIAAGFAAWLEEKKKVNGSRKLKVSIGHDSRISADSLQSAAARGLQAAGVDVVFYGLASTPAMFNSTLTDQEDLLCPVDGSIMLTASHLPYNRNGLKFFTNAGGLGKGDITDILARAANIFDAKKEPQSSSDVAVDKVDYMDHYTQDLVDAVRKGAFDIERPLEGFRIVVDAGNGAGGFFAGKVLEPLGAVTTGSQFLDPDGMFPNHIPNPENEDAMKAITKAVLDNKADLGIIFDTDVDRSAAVDSSGRELNRNRLIALMSAIVLAEHPGTTIVTDSVTSDGLTTFIEQKLGGKHHRFKRGYRNVIDEGIRLNQTGVETHLAIETSGHGALQENNWLDDGAYLMVKLLIKLAAAKAAGQGKGSEALSNLIGELKEADFASELRFKIDQKHPDLGTGNFREYGEKVLSKLESVIKSDPDLQKAAVNYEGVRVSGFGGWFLLRLSLHDPVLPLNIEAPSKEAAAKLGVAVLSVVEDFKALDISPLAKFVASMT